MNCFIFLPTLDYLIELFYAFIMEKYHKDIGFFPCHVREVKALIDALKCRRLSFSVHSLNELAKESDAVLIGRFLKDYTLNFNDVFELAYDAGRLEKIGFRVNFGENDVVFIVSRQKVIITLWINDKKDLHFTLDITKYCTV